VSGSLLIPRVGRQHPEINQQEVKLRSKARSPASQFKNTICSVHPVMENLEKSRKLYMVFFQACKSPGGKNPKGFGRVMEICYIHMCISTEFLSDNMLLKE